MRLVLRLVKVVTEPLRRLLQSRLHSFDVLLSGRELLPCLHRCRLHLRQSLLGGANGPRPRGDASRTDRTKLSGHGLRRESIELDAARRRGLHGHRLRLCTR